jgi:FtsP/CotA-like multicopper oxidase with cupredoxin domain
MAKTTRRLRVERQNGEWKINGMSWADVIASNFQKVVANPGANDVEIWEIENKSGGWFHPVHIHLVDFHILSRNGQRAHSYEEGPKDVMYVGENETVQAIMRFEHQKGRYMVHCHNLPHEDHDMMLQFRVGLKQGEADPNDPITAARPVFDTPAP